MVRTASGGFHRYLLVPSGYRIHSTVALWPGIDVLTAGSSVILPGVEPMANTARCVRLTKPNSRGAAPIRRPDPRVAGGDQHRPVARNAIRSSRRVGHLRVSQRQWCLLFKNRVFRSFWRRQGKAGSNGFGLRVPPPGQACFCCGLNHRQAEHVVVLWRQRHKGCSVAFGETPGGDCCDHLGGS